MSFVDEPIRWSDPRATELRAILVNGFDSKSQAAIFLDIAGVDTNDIDQDGALTEVWTRTLEHVARTGKLLAVLRAAHDHANFHAAKPFLAELIGASTAPAHPAGEVEKCHLADFVGRRPFVNRAPLRDNLSLLFGDGADRVMIVNGPRGSGRSYTWVLISHVAARSNAFPVTLIDLARFVDAQPTPFDVASMIAADLGWTPHDVDPTAQDATKARLLIGWIKRQITATGPACLVFDGLDGANLSPTTLSFIGDLAVAAGNEQVGGCRVVLLAFGQSLPNPAVDPFVLREPPLHDIKLADMTGFLQRVAAEGRAELPEEQARTLVASVFGDPPPDPLPVALLRDQAAAVARLAWALKDGSGG